MTTSRTLLGLRVATILASIVVLVGVMAPVTWAQSDDALQERIRQRIENDDQLKERDRLQLREHLRDCEELGLSDATVEALFADGEPLREQIRLQSRVLTMARERLPIEPLVEKLREGRRKQVGEPALERVCSQLEQHVRTAAQVMNRARESGLQPGDDTTEKRLTESLALNMWRGLGEGDCDQLMERARQRLRDGSCSTTDLAAASATATELRELGLERERAMRMAGDALQNGYTAREIRQMARMVMAAHAHGQAVDEVVGHVQAGLQQHEQMGELMQHMWQRGWMGPGEDHGGRGGHSPVDDVIGGPGDRHGGGGSHSGSGGGPDDDGHGGGHDGGDTGGQGSGGSGGQGGPGGGGGS